MKITLKIARCPGPGQPRHDECYTLDAREKDSVSSLLRTLDARTDLRDDDGRLASPILWDQNCNQKACGACAMRIAGVPRLACSTFAGDLLAQGKGAPVTLEPLSVFPLVADLKVDRSILSAYQKELALWLEGDARVSAEEWVTQYDSATCMLCGCCLEVCPNYSGCGKFRGPAMMNAMYRLESQMEKGSGRRAMLRRFGKYGIGGCSRSLACENICPAGIPLSVTISRACGAMWRSRLHLEK